MKIFNEDSSLPTVISLCDYSGRWPYFYAKAGHPVFLFDLKHGDDIVERQAEVLMVGSKQKEILLILASPPCTHFTVSGAQYWKEKDKDGRTDSHLKIVDSCLEIIEILKPKYWALENPVGRLPKLRPNLGKPNYYFDPFQYAGYADDPDRDRYTKKTGIWGENMRPPEKPLPPIRSCPQGSWIQRLGGKSERTKTLRSMTPLGFAKAFYEIHQ